MKNSKQKSKSSAPNGQLCFHCKQPGHLKKDCPEQPYCSRCRTRGHVPTRCPAKQQGQIRKDVNFGRTVRAMKLAKKSGKSHRISHSSHTRTTNVYTVPVITNLVIAPRDNNIRPTPLAILPVVQVFIRAVNFQTLHILHSKANPLLVSPHLHSQSLNHHFSIISNICLQLTNN